MNADTAQRVISVIAKFKKIPEEQVSLDTSLKDLELDSLDGLNLVFELEEEFNIFIPDDKALSLQKVGDMVQGIDALLTEKSAEENSASVGEKPSKIESPTALDSDEKL